MDLRSTFLLSFSVALTSGASAQFIGPTPYQSVLDSPFLSATFEDFEDGSLMAGITADTGVILGPGAQTDSVDSDDGAIDGFGNGGTSWYLSAPSVTFKFDSSVLGGLPTKAGLVWTDVGSVSTGTFGFANVDFAAFDENGNSLGVIGAGPLGDGSVSGGTIEDRFFGIVYAGGISAITISVPDSTDWEVDHVQFAEIVPEPSLMAAFVLGALSLAGKRRRC